MLSYTSVVTKDLYPQTEGSGSTPSMPQLGLAGPKMIALAGYSGCGKSTIAYRMSRKLGATLFQLDWTLIERDKRRSPDFIDKFDLQEAEEIIKKLCAFQPVTYLAYSQVTAKRDHRITLVPSHTLIIDGILSLLIPFVREHALTFFVDAPIETCEARQFRRWRNEGWYPGVEEEEVRRRILVKRTEELPFVLELRRYCHWVLDNSADQEIEEMLTVMQRHPSLDKPILLAVANDALKPDVAQIFQAYRDVIDTRYDIIAGTTGTLSMVKEFFPSKWTVDLGHGPDFGDIRATMFVIEHRAAGRRLEALVLLDPSMEPHQLDKTVLLFSLIKAGAVFWPTPASATAFLASLLSSDVASG